MVSKMRGVQTTQPRMEHVKVWQGMRTHMEAGGLISIYPPGKRAQQEKHPCVRSRRLLVSGIAVAKTHTSETALKVLWSKRTPLPPFPWCTIRVMASEALSHSPASTHCLMRWLNETLLSWPSFPIACHATPRRATPQQEKTGREGGGARENRGLRAPRADNREQTGEPRRRAPESGNRTTWYATHRKKKKKKLDRWAQRNEHRLPQRDGKEESGLLLLLLQVPRSPPPQPSP